MSEKHHRPPAADERPETDFHPFDEKTGRSRMAREAKIGLAAILILLIAFGVVLYRRLTKVDENPEVSAEAASSQTEGEGSGFNVPGSGDKDQGLGAGGSAQVFNSQFPTPSANWKQPTIVAAKPGGDDAAPETSAANVDSWGAVAEDRRAAERDLGTTSQSSAPSFMPKLVEARPASRYADDAQVGMSEAADSAGPLLPTTQVNLAGQPDLQPTGDSYQSSSPQENPLRGQTGAAGSTGDGSQAPMPIYPPSAHSTYRATPEPSDPTRQVGVSVPAPGQSEVNPKHASEEAALGSDAGRQWVSGGAAVQASARLSNVSTPASTPGGLGQPHAAAMSLGKDGTYVVQPNDNYWLISQKLYGTGAYFRALAQHNRTKIPDANRLRLGDTILAPEASELEKAYPDLCPKPAHREAAQRRTLLTGTQRPIGAGRVYVVQEGDNLFDIARYELGKATRWTEIVDLNTGLLGADLNDLNYLTPGMRLILPDDQPASRVAREPNSLYQR